MADIGTTLKQNWYFVVIGALVLLVLVMYFHPPTDSQILTKKARKQVVQQDQVFAKQLGQDTAAANKATEASAQYYQQGVKLADHAQRLRIQTHPKPLPRSHAKATRPDTVYADSTIQRLQRVLTNFGNMPDPAAGKAHY